MTKPSGKDIMKIHHPRTNNGMVWHVVHNKKPFITAYHPYTKGRPERANPTLLSMPASYMVFDLPDNPGQMNEHFYSCSDCT